MYDKEQIDWNLFCVCVCVFPHEYIFHPLNEYIYPTKRIIFFEKKKNIKENVENKWITSKFAFPLSFLIWKK